MIDYNINRTPPQNNVYELVAQPCQYCHQFNICRKYPIVRLPNIPNKRIVRFILCEDCMYKQFVCDNCGIQFEGYPRQPLHEIRFLEDDRETIWNSINHPLEGPTYCRPCDRQIQRQLLLGYNVNPKRVCAVAWPSGTFF